ncbi:putative transcription factor MYB-HB-like family [Helianthus annuus]|nr:putative transcription factor MYB-HB-like family [Helianthus annuus]
MFHNISCFLLTAHSSAILEHMNVPGLTRHHVASHLQKYHKRRKLIEASIAENIANERWLSTHSNNSASIIQSSSLLKLPRLNLSGILYVGIKKIMARLQEARPLPVPHPTTTPSNNYCGDQATDHSLRVVESSNSGGHGTEIQQAMEPQVTCKISSQYPFGEAMAPLGVENSNSGRQGTKIQQIGHDYENAMEPQVPGELSSHHPFGEAIAPLGMKGHVYENAMAPQVPGELSSHHPFGEAIAPLGFENSNSGGQGNEIQLRRHVHENAMEPQVPGEFSSHHPFGEAMAPLGVENSNDVGQGIEVQLKGHGYGNAMEPQVTGELASCHAFGEAVAPLGVESFSNGGQGTEYQLISQDHAMELQVTSEISYHAFGEAVAPLGVENTNNGGQGTEYQLIGHDYGNAMEPQVTSEISLCHAFEEAVAPSGVENSNKGGQGTEYQLIGQNYGNAMEPQVTSEISSYRAFGEATAPFSVEDYINYDGQGIDVQLIGNDYGNAIEPQVTAEASSHHAYGEPMSPLGVGANAASDNNLGMDVNGLHSSLNNRNFGDASGSGLGEVQVQVSCSGPATDPCVADCEGDAGLLNDSLEGLDWPDFFSLDAEGRLCPSQEAHVNRLNDSLEGLDWPDFFSFDAEGRLCSSQEAHVNRENLGVACPRSATHLNVENQINPGSNPDSMPIQPTSADFSFPEVPIEEDDSLAQAQLPVNSGVPLDGSQARFIDNDLSQSDLENAMSLLDDDDGYLFDGLFYF